MKIGFLFRDSKFCDLNDLESLKICNDQGFATNFSWTLHMILLTRPNSIQFFGFDFLLDSEKPKNFIKNSIVESLAKGEIDVTNSLMFTTEQKLAKFSYASPFIVDRFCFYMKEPKFFDPRQNIFYFLSPFHFTTWCLFLASITAFVSLYGLSHVLKFRWAKLKFQHQLFVYYRNNFNSISHSLLLIQ